MATTSNAAPAVIAAGAVDAVVGRVRDRVERSMTPQQIRDLLSEVSAELKIGTDGDPVRGSVWVSLDGSRTLELVSETMPWRGERGFRLRNVSTGRMTEISYSGLQRKFCPIGGRAVL